MTNVWKNIVAGAMLVGASTLVTSQVLSQDGALGQDPRMAEVMARYEAWMKYGAPGKEHAKLRKQTGTWLNENKHWMFPGGPVNASDAVAVLRPIMGGRFMVEEMRGVGEMQPGVKQAFEGLGIFGYDNYREKHFFIWFDSMSSSYMLGEGEANARGEIVYHSELPDPSTGATLHYKSVSRQTSEDKYVFEMFEKQADGSWFRNMEVVATRQP